MLRLCSKITVVNPKGKTYNLDFTDQVTVKSGWEYMTDSAEITLPKNAYVRINNSPFRTSLAKLRLGANSSTGSDAPAFEISNPVKIELGYNGKFETVFYGLITKIEENAPFKLECQDVLWCLKNVQIPEKKFDSTVELSSVLSYLSNIINQNTDIKNLANIIPIKEGAAAFNQKFEIVNALNEKLELSNFNILNKSVYAVLSELKENYELEIFARGNKIYVGEAYPETLKSKKPKKLGIQYNVIEHELINMQKTKIPVSVEAHSFDTLNDPGNVEHVLEGDSPNKIQINKFNVSTEALKSIARRKLRKHSYDGFKGHLLTFGTPFIQHGDEANLKDIQMRSREGTFKVRSVEYSFGSGGYRQKIELHEKV